jgi:hypothetical protein
MTLEEEPGNFQNRQRVNQQVLQSINQLVKAWVKLRSRDSSVGIAKGYGLDGWGSITGSVDTGPGAHPGSYPTVTGGTFTMVKPKGRVADHLPPI